MTKQTSRRDMIKGSVALAGLGVLGLPEWAFPALTQDQTLVRFTDLPDNIVLERTPDRRIIDIRGIDGVFTPSDQFFTTQHYGHPEIDTATYRLQVSGLVDRPLSLSLADLRALPSRELVFGFECSGNRGPVNGLSSNGRWRGVPLRAVLERAGVQAEAAQSRNSDASFDHVTTAGLLCHVGFLSRNVFVATSEYEAVARHRLCGPPEC